MYPVIKGAVILTVLVAPVFASASEIHDAVKRRNLAGIRSLLKTNAALVNDTMEDGVTPLHIAAGLDAGHIAELLIANGANIDAKTDTGSTPLHWAAMRNASKAAALLIENGADIEARAGYGMTPLEVAIKRGSRDVIDIIASAADKALLTDPRFLAGQTALKAGKLDKAFDIFNQLLREYPDNDHLNIAAGRTAYVLKKYPHASAAFQRILLKSPGNDQARLELGRAYFMQGQFDLARQEFRDVFKRTSHPLVRANIKKYLDQMDEITRVGHWKAHVSIGGFHDSNVNVGPDSDAVSIEPIVYGGTTYDELLVDDESLPASVLGAFSSVTISGLYDVGERGNWVLAGRGDYYQTWLDGQYSCETLYCGAQGGMRYTSGSHILELPLQAKYIARGHESLVNIFGVDPSWLFAFGQEYEWNWITAAALEYRDYHELDDRDGPFVSVTGALRRFWGKSRHSMTAALSFLHEHTDAAQYQNSGIQCSITGKVNLPWQSTAYAQAKYSATDYGDSRPLEHGNGEDRQQQYTIGATRMISERWGVNVDAQITANSSTFDLYDYNRQVITLGTFYSF